MRKAIYLFFLVVVFLVFIYTSRDFYVNNDQKKIINVFLSGSLEAQDDLSSLNANRMHVPLRRDLCSYSISDYELMRHEIETFFQGQNLDGAYSDFSRLGIKETKEYQLLERKNGKVVVQDGNAVMSEEKLLIGRTECPLPNSNKNIWQIEIHVDELGGIIETGFYVFIEDQNFFSRGIPLKASYIGSNAALSSAILSLSEKLFPDWELLKQHLLQAGFLVTEKVYENSKQKSASVRKPFDHNHLASRMYAGVEMQAFLTISEDGKIRSVRD